MSSKKPHKPYPSFPLYQHKGSGQWAKTIKGKKRYFGSFREDPDGVEAIRLYNLKAPYYHSGQEPPEIVSGVTIAELVQHFYDREKVRHAAGEIADSSLTDCKNVGQTLIDGLGPTRPVAAIGAIELADLRSQLLKRYALSRTAKLITVIRSILTYAYDQEFIAEPIRFGRSFRKPSASAMRREKESGPDPIIPAGVTRQLIENADWDLKAWILLGLNCAYWPNDVSQLTKQRVDLENARIEWPRPKTAIRRTAVLWPETVAALVVAGEKRPEPKDDSLADRMFLTRRGGELVKNKTDAINPRLRDALDELGERKPKRTFGSFRKAVETYGGRCRDQVAVDAVMGHGGRSMAEVYRVSLEDGEQRISAVCEEVRRWLWPDLYD